MGADVSVFFDHRRLQLPLWDTSGLWVCPRLWLGGGGPVRASSVAGVAGSWFGNRADESPAVLKPTGDATAGARPRPTPPDKRPGQPQWAQGCAWRHSLPKISNCPSRRRAQPLAPLSCSLPHGPRPGPGGGPVGQSQLPQPGRRPALHGRRNRHPREGPAHAPARWGGVTGHRVPEARGFMGLMLWFGVRWPTSRSAARATPCGRRSNCVVSSDPVHCDQSYQADLLLRHRRALFRCQGYRVGCISDGFLGRGAAVESDEEVGRPPACGGGGRSGCIRDCFLGRRDSPAHRPRAPVGL